MHQLLSLFCFNIYVSLSTIQGLFGFWEPRCGNCDLYACKLMPDLSELSTQSSTNFLHTYFLFSARPSLEDDAHILAAKILTNTRWQKNETEHYNHLLLPLVSRPDIVDFFSWFNCCNVLKLLLRNGKLYMEILTSCGDSRTCRRKRNLVLTG